MRWSGVQSPDMKRNQIWSAAGVVAVLAVLAALFIGVPAAIEANRPAVATAPKPGVQEAHLLRSDFKHPLPPPPPVVEVAAPEDTYVEAPYSNAGSAVPFIPSADPNNASGGDYMDPGSYCTSGSASGFPPVCD